MRKNDHIKLAMDAQISKSTGDKRFFYEPLLSPNRPGPLEPLAFLGKSLKAPMWISSMTGGTDAAAQINFNLARACKDFGLGMGLGSCRQLLTSDEHLKDFDVREICGDEVPLFANLGIAQVEELLVQGKTNLIDELVKKLRADGIFIHINPLQEYLQPEGDRYRMSAIDTLSRLFDTVKSPVAIKEVGQGMGPKSLEQVLKLPIVAIELGALGGTNFSQLESLRMSCPISQNIKQGFVNQGHSAEEMITFLNSISCSHDIDIIVSGGIQGPIDGYYHNQISKFTSVYGIASRILPHALSSYTEVQTFFATEIESYQMAQSFLTLRPR